jgi:type I restriction enzyme S subunit
MSDWTSIRLGDSARWLSGGTPSTSQPSYWGGDIPWISAASLKDFYINSSERNVTSEGAANGTSLVPAGTIIFIVRGMSLMSEFRVGITMREVAFGQDCKALMPKKGIDPLFLAYAIKAKTQNILGLVDAAGHGTGRLQTDRIADLSISVPGDAKRQRAVVEPLKALDDKIVANDRIASTGEDFACMTATEMRWAARAPLGRFVKLTRDQVAPENFGSKTVALYSLPAFDARRLPELIAASSIKSNKFVVDAPCVLLSKLNPSIPRVWSVRPSPGTPAVASTEFLVLKPIDGISPDEIWAVCRQPQFINELMGKVTGTSNSHQRVKPADLLATNVVNPQTIPATERELICSISGRIRQARYESVALSKLRDTLLPLLMSGEIRVRDAENAVEEAT